MADHVVSTEFRLYDNSTKALGKIRLAAGDARRSLNEATRGLRELTRTSLMGMAASVGVGFGIYEMGKRIYEAGESAERMQYRMAAMAQALGLVRPGEIQKGLAVGKEMIEETKESADKLGLSFTELMDTIPNLALQAGQAGVPFGAVRDIIAGLAPTAKLAGVGVQDLGQMIQMALVGRVPRQLKMMLQGLGMVPAKLKEMQARAMFGDVRGIMAILQTASRTTAAVANQATYLETDEAVWARIRNITQDILKTTGGIVQVEIREYLEGAAKWLKENREYVRQIATDVGYGIVEGLKLMGKLLGFVAEHWRQILAAVVAYKTVVTALAITRGITGVAGVVGGALGVGGIAAGTAGVAGAVGGAAATAGFAGLPAAGGMGLMGTLAMGAAGIAAAGYAGWMLGRGLDWLLHKSETLGAAIDKPIKAASDLWSWLKGESEADYQRKADVAVKRALAYQKEHIATKPSPVAKPAQTIINVHGGMTFHQTFKDGSPDKVLAGVVEQFARLAEKQRVSPMAPLFGAAG